MTRMREAVEVGTGVIPSANAAPDFEAFFLDHYEDMFGALWLVTRSRDEAQEIAQDAFLKVWERWDRVREMATLFEVTLGLPGAELTDGAVDPVGRPATLVTVRFGDIGLYRLYFDPQTRQGARCGQWLDRRWRVRPDLAGQRQRGHHRRGAERG
jgi:hypothetical protein